MEHFLIGSEIVIIGEVFAHDGSFTIKDGRRWTFAQDRHTRAHLGKRAKVRGEVIGSGRLKVLEIEAA